MNSRLMYFTLLFLLAGCAYQASVLTRVDPAYMPIPTEPAALVVAQNSSIQERQLLPLLREQMVKRHFNLVELTDAKWVIGFGGGTSAVYVGTAGSAVAIPFFGNAIGISSSAPIYADIGKLNLTVFPADSFRAGQPLPVWQGAISVESDAYVEKPRTIIDVLLDNYGKNFDDEGLSLPRGKDGR